MSGRARSVFSHTLAHSLPSTSHFDFGSCILDVPVRLHRRSTSRCPRPPTQRAHVLGRARQDVQAQFFNGTTHASQTNCQLYNPSTCSGYSLDMLTSEPPSSPLLSSVLILSRPEVLFLVDTVRTTTTCRPVRKQFFTS